MGGCNGKETMGGCNGKETKLLFSLLEEIVPSKRIEMQSWLVGTYVPDEFAHMLHFLSVTFAHFAHLTKIAITLPFIKLGPPDFAW